MVVNLQGGKGVRASESGSECEGVDQEFSVAHTLRLHLQNDAGDAAEGPSAHEVREGFEMIYPP